MKRYITSHIESHTSPYSSTYSSHHSSHHNPSWYGYGGYGYGYGGYGLSLLSRQRENLEKILKFLWVDLDIEGVIPEKPKIEIIGSSKVDTPLFSVFSDGTYSITINHKTYIDKANIERAVIAKLAEIHHPFFKKFHSGTSESKSLLNKTVSAVFGLKFFDFNTEVTNLFVSSAKKVSAGLAQIIQDRIIFDGYMPSVREEDAKAVLEIWGLLDEDTKERADESDKEFFHKLGELFEQKNKQDSTSEVQNHFVSFLMSVQAEGVLLANHPSLKRSITGQWKSALSSFPDGFIKDVLSHLYHDVSHSLTEELITSGEFIEIAKKFLSRYTWGEIEKELKAFDKYELHKFEQFRLVAIENTAAHSQQSKQQCEAQREAAIDGNEAMEGNSKTIKEKKKQKEQQKNTKTGKMPGHGFGEGVVEEAHIDPQIFAQLDVPTQPENVVSKRTLQYFSHIIDEMATRYEKNQEEIEKNIFTKKFFAAWKKLEKLFEDHSKPKTTTVVPSKRLKTRNFGRHMLSPSVGLYKKNGKKTTTQKPINIICDLSGSMGGAPSIGMRQLLIIFNRIFKAKNVPANLILSTPAGAVAFKFPVSETFLTFLATPFGSEGLKPTFDDTVHLLRKAKANFVFTDAQITDMAWEQSHYEKKGIYLTGVFCVSEKISKSNFERRKPYIKENMERYFSKNAVQPDIESLAADLIKKANLK